MRNGYAAPIFLGDSGQFLWLSERDGFMHLYLYTAEGKLVRQLTRGDWMIDTSAWNLLTPGRPVHVDPANGWAYFIATKSSPLERQIYRVNIGNGRLEQVSQSRGSTLPRFLVTAATWWISSPMLIRRPTTRIVKTDGAAARPCWPRLPGRH